MSVKALRYIQMGQEVTAGTLVAATAIWRGLGTIEDALEPKFPEEDVGYLSGTERVYIPKVLGKLSMDSVEATFEQLPYILSAGVKSVVTGAADGAGSGKIYAYPFSINAANAFKTYTLEGGDDQQEEEMGYCFVEKFKLTGKAGEAVKMQADWLGREVAPSTKTPTLSLVTVEEILLSKGKLYIDALSGTMGTTQKSNTLLAYDLEVTTGLIPKHTADGALYFSFAKMVRPEVVAKITFEHDGVAVAEKANWRAKTGRQIRLGIDGSALTTPGTGYTYKTLRIDLAGLWEKFDKIGEQDGNDIVTGTFRARYCATPAKFAEIIVVNEVASLP